MLKQKNVNAMLNILIKHHFSAIKNKQVLLLLVILAAMLMPACSATQQESSAANDRGALNDKHKESFAEAISAMKAGKLKKAQTILISLINERPDFSTAHLNLGIIFLKNNSLVEAENSFQQALKTEPENIYALNQLGILYRQQGNFTDSKSAYEKAININSEYAFAYLNLGILYDLYLYDFPMAIEQYKKYLDIADDKDKKISKWIIDLERRHKKSLSKK